MVPVPAEREEVAPTIAAPAPAAAVSSSSAAPMDVSDSDDEESTKEYVVEKILKKRETAAGVTQYFIKWVGYDSSENTWEPEENLNCGELIEKFDVGERKQSCEGFVLGIPLLI